MNPALSTPSAPRTDLGRVQRFTLAAQAVAATVECVAASPDALAAGISRIATRADATRIAIAEPHDIPDARFAACRNLPGSVTGRTRRDLTTCDIDVTDTFAAIATTGTVFVRLNPSFSHYVSRQLRLQKGLLRTRHRRRSQAQRPLEA